jgi:hypothetical protein
MTEMLVDRALAVAGTAYEEETGNVLDYGGFLAAMAAYNELVASFLYEISDETGDVLVMDAEQIIVGDV